MSKEIETAWPTGAGSIIQPNDDTIYMICLSSWDYLINQKQADYFDGQVVYSGVEKHDAINMTVWGKVLQDGIWYAFICNEGNNAGTDIIEWQPATDGLLAPEPKQPNPMRLVLPENKINGLAVKKFHAAKSSPWFLELERGYNYDLCAQPGIVTTEYYQGQAQKYGLEWRRYQSISNDCRALLGIVL